MGLDPGISASIKRYRRSNDRRTLLLLARFALAVAFCLGITIIPFALGRASIDPGSVARGDEQATAALVIGLTVFAFFIGFCLTNYQKARSARSHFRAYTKPVEGDLPPYVVFGGTVGKLSDSAGMPAPGVAVLDDGSPNAAAYLGRRKRPTIGVNGGLTAADLPSAEFDAVLAHEVARLAIGEDLKRPGLLQPEFLPDTFFTFCMAIPLLVIFFVRIEGNFLWLPTIAAATVVALVLVLRWSEGYNARAVETSRHQQDLMADAIAVRLTGDAGSLHSAITKLAQSNREPGSDPSVGKYLFVGPQAGDALISLKFHHAPVVLQTGRGSLVAERLENLEMVMDGRWRPFDRPEGD